jgi:DNA repair exonuclease SbcCD ATPase subunit
MINFHLLTYSNFLSVGDTPITIDFEATKSTLIVGHNGSGKSLMLDALSFALFGKPHRAINKPQLINSINGKKCLVEITFSVGNKNYKIIRGLKPNIFEIWVNGEMINQESHSRDFQKLLETNILKLNHKSFHQVVVLGNGNFVPFMQMRQYERRNVIEDLLDISIFSKMNTILKDNNAKLKDQIKDNEYQWKLIKEKIILQRKHIDKLSDISESNRAKYESEIADIQSEQNVLIESNEKILVRYKAEHSDTEKKLNTLNRSLNKMKSFESQIKSKMNSIEKEADFYKSNSACPTCSQTIDTVIRDSKLESCGCKQEELTDGFEKLQNSIKSTNDQLVATNHEMQELFKLNNEMTSNNVLIKNFSKRITELSNQKNEIADDNDLKKSQNELLDMQTTRDNLSDLKSNQIEERHYNDVIGELLKDTGIKTKIIRQYLPPMNKLINNYLQLLDFFVSFELDENFNETIRSRHRDDFSYASFSEGEKQRIDLSLLFAWRQIAKMKNSANTNLLILDEVFDASLDFDGIDNLLKIMHSLDDETRVFVISHKQDLLEGKFDRKIEFQRRQNFTSIKSIT